MIALSMGWHIVQRSLPCSPCGGSLLSIIVASTWPGEIRVSDSWRCPTCDSAREADGYGLAAEYQALFIAVEGRWSATIQDSGPRKTVVGKRIRELLAVTPQRAMVLLRGEDALLVGALVEAEHVAEPLVTLGACVEFRQVEPPR